MPSEGLGRKDHHTILHGPSKGSFALSLFPVQLQNVKDDRSPLCEARGKASRAEGVQEDSQGVSQNMWIVEGRGLPPCVIPLQPFHQTMTGRSKFPKCTRDAYRMQWRQPLLHSNLDIF